MLADDVLPTFSMLKYSWSAVQPGVVGQLDHHGLVGLVGHDQVDAVQQRRRLAVRVGLVLQLIDHLQRGSGPPATFTSGPYTVMLLSNSGLGQMIELTSLTGPLA